MGLDENDLLNMDITDADARILSYMLDNKHIIPSRGVSMNNVIVDKGDGKTIARVTVGKTIRKLKSKDFVQEGVMCGRAKTYYITEKGIALYTHLFGISNKRKQAITTSILGVTNCFNQDNDDIDYDAIVNEVLNTQKIK